MTEREKSRNEISKAMNKTVKTILQILSYIIAAILGAAGEAAIM